MRATALESRFAGEGEKRFEKKHLSRFGPSPLEQQEAVKDLTEFLTGARMPDGFTKHEARVQLLVDKAKEYGSLAKALGEFPAAKPPVVPRKKRPTDATGVESGNAPAEKKCRLGSVASLGDGAEEPEAATSSSYTPTPSAIVKGVEPPVDAMVVCSLAGRDLSQYDRRHLHNERAQYDVHMAGTSYVPPPLTPHASLANRVFSELALQLTGVLDIMSAEQVAAVDQTAVSASVAKFLASLVPPTAAGMAKTPATVSLLPAATPTPPALLPPVECMLPQPTVSNVATPAPLALPSPMLPESTTTPDVAMPAPPALPSPLPPAPPTLDMWAMTPTQRWDTFGHLLRGYSMGPERSPAITDRLLRLMRQLDELRGGKPFAIFLAGRLKTENDADACKASHAGAKYYNLVESSRLPDDELLQHSLPNPAAATAGMSDWCSVSAVFSSADLLAPIVAACDPRSLEELARVSSRVREVSLVRISSLKARVKLFRGKHLPHCNGAPPVIGQDGLLRKKKGKGKVEWLERGPSYSFYLSFERNDAFGACIRTVETPEPTVAPADDISCEEVLSWLAPGSRFPEEGKELLKLCDMLQVDSWFAYAASIVAPHVLGNRAPVQIWAVNSGLETAPRPMIVNRPPWGLTGAAAGRVFADPTSMARSRHGDAHATYHPLSFDLDECELPMLLGVEYTEWQASPQTGGDAYTGGVTRFGELAAHNAAAAAAAAAVDPETGTSRAQDRGFKASLARYGKTEDGREAELQAAVANASSTSVSGSSTVDYDLINQPELRGLYAGLRKKMKDQRLPTSVDMRKAGGDNKIKIALRMRDAAKSVDDILAAIQ